jgi:hypothetical protein
MKFRLIRRFTDGSLEVSDRTVDLTDAYVGLRFNSRVPGKAWEIAEVIRDTKPLPTAIVVLVTE